jgi:DNA-binding Xre family transcriptional regulator
MLVRVRIPELLEAAGLTPYGLCQASGGRISMSTAYRLARNKGRAHTFDAELLEALCDVLKVTPGDLLEREPRKGRR